MNDRRKFLTTTIAMAGSAVLAACGADDNLTSSAKLNAMSATRASSPSPNGSVIPPLNSIADAQGGVWTVANGVVKLNGQSAGYTNLVTLLVYYNSTVYQQNQVGDWWSWNGTGWVATANDPRPAEDLVFYGINTHSTVGDNTYGTVPFSTQIAQMRQMGVTMVRTNGNGSSEVGQLKTFIQQLQGTGMQAYPCIDQYLDTSNTSMTEQDYYNQGYSLGQTAASGLKGLVGYYEVGNEIDSQLLLSGAYNGDVPSQYSNQLFPLARGLVRGMIDGIKSIDTAAKIIAPACSWLHFAFSDMLWNGTQPDGSSGYPQVRWDIEAWHWYSDMGNILAASSYEGVTNVLATLQPRRNLPIWLTEFGVRPFSNGVPGVSGVPTEKQMGNWLLDQGSTQGGYPTVESVAAQYGVQAIMLFELYDDPNDGNYGVIAADGTTLKGRYARLQSYMGANPPATFL
ncbi:hypothetical protein [Paraburkholderia dilworthii]|uniref:Glycosyl hydrolase catalytic core n=1 Tax=Paraburkholderia dilworthii TaxID=948106 RepID=A0ABW9D714_9BURK